MEATRVEQAVNGTAQRLSPLAFKLKNKPNLAVTPELAYELARAYANLGKIDKAEYYLTIAVTDEKMEVLVKTLEDAIGR